MTKIALLAVMAATAPPWELSLLCDLSRLSESDQRTVETVQAVGTYERSFETSSFTPLGSQESWWVYDKELNQLTQRKGATELRLVLRGRLSPPGRYGHGLQYPRCLGDPSLVKVIEDPKKCGRVIMGPRSDGRMYVFCDKFATMARREAIQVVRNLLENASRPNEPIDIIILRDESVFYRPGAPIEISKVLDEWDDAIVGIYESDTATYWIRGEIERVWRDITVAED